MFGVGKRVAVGNIKLFVINIVQEHVDTAKVVGGNVDFLTIKTLPNIFFT